MTRSDGGAIGSGVSGVFVLVVGPSGAGKDTLIDLAREALAADRRYVFARRTVTRVASAEDHDTMTSDQFDAAEQAGAFALSWRSHGLGYGIPRAVIEMAEAGDAVVINASRSVIAEAVRIAPRVAVVHVTAPPAVLAARLAMRGRETAAAIEHRLAREVRLDASGAELFEIDNSAPPEIGGAALVEILRRVAAFTQEAPPQ